VDSSVKLLSKVFLLTQNLIMKNNYQSALERINKANDEESLLHLEKSLERLWNNGIFTANEFSKLDEKLLSKLISIDPYKFG